MAYQQRRSPSTENAMQGLTTVKVGPKGGQEGNRFWLNDQADQLNCSLCSDKETYFENIAILFQKY